MPKENAEFNDIRSNSAVADLTGRRHGRVVVVIGKGLFRIRWDDGGDDSTLSRDQILSRYTTQSRQFTVPRNV